MRSRAFLHVALVCGALPLSAQGTGQAQAEVERTLNALLRSVEHADMAAFLALHDEQATMFHYLVQPPRRLRGKIQIEDSMGGVFEGIKANSGRAAGPYLDIP